MVNRIGRGERRGPARDEPADGGRVELINTASGQARERILSDALARQIPTRRCTHL